MPSFALALFAALVAGLSGLTSVARGETLGSQTRVTIAGVYILEGGYTSTESPNGAYRSTSTVVKARYGNRDILETMVGRGLLPSIKGYSLVMLRTELGTRSFTFVATHKTAAPVRVPDDLLFLEFGFGPEQGRFAYNSNEVITELAYTSYDIATLRLDGFEGQALLTRKSSRKNVRRDGEIVTVKLDSGNAAFDGNVYLNNINGVGTARFTLSGAKVVSLDHFGADAPDGTADLIGGGSGGTVVEMPLLPPVIAYPIDGTE